MMASQFPASYAVARCGADWMVASFAWCMAMPLHDCPHHLQQRMVHPPLISITPPESGGLESDMSRCLLILLLASATATASAEPPRFAGAAQLRPPDTTSADGRFSLDAKLQPAIAISTDGRLTLKAALQPDARSIAGVCGNDHLFSNGFDS